jgi:hypothetical protein
MKFEISQLLFDSFRARQSEFGLVDIRSNHGAGVANDACHVEGDITASAADV